MTAVQAMQTQHFWFLVPVRVCFVGPRVHFMLDLGKNCFFNTTYGKG